LNLWEKRIYLYLDSVKTQEIRTITEFIPIRGITSNPFLFRGVCHNKEDYLALVRELADFEVKEVHVQAPGKTFEELMSNAERIAAISQKIIIKIPIHDKNCLKAIGELKRRGLKVTATAIANPIQALVASTYDVDYVAIFMNRIEKAGGDSCKVIKTIRKAFDENNIETRILAASVHTRQQVIEAILSGANGVTLPARILEKLYRDNVTESIAKEMSEAWAGFYW
jgi:TalC/MipB family fructose-6-phosphate aldolase